MHAADAASWSEAVLPLSAAETEQGNLCQGAGRLFMLQEGKAALQGGEGGGHSSPWSAGAVVTQVQDRTWAASHRC